jgi:hypothetical protein
MMNSYELTQIDLAQLGRFETAPATFWRLRYWLPAKWEYVYNYPRELLTISGAAHGCEEFHAPENF